MPRKRDPARNTAKEIWLKSGRKAKLKDIAHQLGKTASQIRKWKSQDQWEQSKGNVTKPKERSVTESFGETLKASTANDKQKLFAILYLRRFNATWAYMKAYGAIYDTAMTNGSKLLRNPKVAKLIDQLKAEQMAELHITNMDLLQELTKQATSDIGDYLDFATERHRVFDKHGKPVKDYETGQQRVREYHRVALKQQTQMDTSLIKSVAIDKGEVKLELYDKQQAIAMLLKNLPTSSAERISNAQARIAEYNAGQLEGAGSSNPILVALAEAMEKRKKGDQHEDAAK